MKPSVELNLLLILLEEYNLPVSKELASAISERFKDFPGSAPSSLSVSTPEDTTLDIDLPSNADVTAQNKYILQFCYRMLTHFSGALSPQENDICHLLLVENSREFAKEKHQTDEARVRQIFVRSIRKITKEFHRSLTEVDDLLSEINKLKTRNGLLEQRIKAGGAEKNDELRNKLQNLCYPATKLLTQPISDYPFSSRTINSLLAAKKETMKDFLTLSKNDLLSLKGLGKRGIQEMEAYFSRYNLSFGMTYYDIVSALYQFNKDNFPSD